MYVIVQAWLELVGDLGFEGKIVNFLMRQGGKMGA